MRAIILASGQGRRLAPLTDHHPKPLLLAANQPLLTYLLHILMKAGVSEVFVTVGYLAEQVVQFLSQVELDVVVTPVPAPHWPQGPLASFSAVLPYLGDSSSFLVLPGDVFLSSLHLEQIAAVSATECALLYDQRGSRPGPQAHLSATGQITKLSFSALPAPQTWSVIPVLQGTAALLEVLLNAQHPPFQTLWDFLQWWVEQGQPLHGVPVSEGFWLDVDRPQDLLALNQHLVTHGWPPTPQPPGTYLPAGVTMHGPVQTHTLTLEAKSRLRGPVLVGPDVHIGSQCLVSEGTVLARSTRVGDNAVLRRCVTFPASHVPVNVDLTGALIDAHGNIVHES